MVKAEQAFSREILNNQATVQYKRKRETERKREKEIGIFKINLKVKFILKSINLIQYKILTLNLRHTLPAHGIQEPNLASLAPLLA